ncbi:hypothetical protein CABS01_06030 [Colletotrichum abscissum]|uniref:uncharacterized protein n=1 Tax=Colletotrichum abscissum TaxID=1671311 RepID=UPI0027D7069E|nr:uncharacterized protein CABS01_06030 [Colletotrichum abscissum]KAK1518496.1 hypothetical protein CABS01_06030 [Colletotrichum abscissum]
MAEYIWIDADGETRSKSRVRSHNNHLVFLIPSFGFFIFSPGPSWCSRRSSPLFHRKMSLTQPFPVAMRHSLRWLMPSL